MSVEDVRKLVLFVYPKIDMKKLMTKNLKKITKADKIKTGLTKFAKFLMSICEPMTMKKMIMKKQSNYWQSWLCLIG